VKAMQGNAAAIVAVEADGPNSAGYLPMAVDLLSLLAATAGLHAKTVTRRI
jgi:hypothetical protein